MVKLKSLLKYCTELNTFSFHGVKHMRHNAIHELYSSAQRFLLLSVGIQIMSLVGSCGLYSNFIYYGRHNVVLFIIQETGNVA